MDSVSSPTAPKHRVPWPSLRRGLIGMVVAGLLFWLGYALLFSPVRAQPMSVERGTVIQRVYGRGTIESERTSQLGFDLIGRISAIEVEEGDHVSLGQTLARLDLDQLTAEFETASSGVDAARASLRRLDAEERAARDALGAAERDERRSRELLERGVTAPLEHDAVLDRMRTARSSLDRVLAQRTEATRGIEVARGGAAARETTVGRASLLSPFDGLVVRRLREPGDTVGVGSTVLRLVDPSALIARAFVDESALLLLEEGQPVEVRFPDDPATYRGHVERIGWEADRQTHEILVDIALDSPPARRVAMGQRVDVWIEVARHDDAVRAPLEALREEHGERFVWRDESGRVGRAPVVLGLIGDDVVELLEGVDEGDRLLVPLEPRASLSIGRAWRAP